MKDTKKHDLYHERKDFHDSDNYKYNPKDMYWEVSPMEFNGTYFW